MSMTKSLAISTMIVSFKQLTAKFDQNRRNLRCSKLPTESITGWYIPDQMATQKLTMVATQLRNVVGITVYKGR